VTDKVSDTASVASDIQGSPMSDKVRLKRYNWLARYDRDSINAIIDAGIVCQVGYVIDGMPYVTPTNHWRIDDYVYWHGSSASRMLKTQQAGIPVCFTVTHLDGIVFSRAAFNHNVKFRSVMAFGSAELCEEQVKRDALRTFTDRLAPGIWDYARPPSDQEWKASKVIRMRLDEVSAKVADGLPDEEADDYASDRWAGYVPLRLQQLAPIADPKLRDGIEIPDFVRNFRYGAQTDSCS
jgi:nitroimidazol reductase NimA-like FMN-containing flavoprotein (pyridoxamine 5'-phosphate oxidase superfamily)